MEPTNQKKAGTGRSAMALVVIVLAAASVIAAVAYALAQPGILESVVNIVIIAIIVILGLALIIYVVMALVAIPMYAYKGEQYQENVDYNLDDVKPVRESSSEDKKNE